MILAFNTSLSDLHIGLFSDEGNPLAEFHKKPLPDERGIHDALLAQKTSDLLNELSAAAKDISIITFINGPGSFTGLRIGLAFAKGMAFGSGTSLVPLIAHSVLLKSYQTQFPQSRNPIPDPRTPILYPGYAKDSFYISYSNEPYKVEYILLSELLKMNLGEFICSPELDSISIPHHTVSISLQTMALMAVSGKDFTPLADLEPFYGTDFKPGKQ
ncbi:MAG: tRNA (adenosine(37)-N6)-threonylcarbamoyltransferase complex dimerization subunit type 1 TsaB [Candidatus Kapaibacterium sp.]